MAKTKSMRHRFLAYVVGTLMLAIPLAGQARPSCQSALSQARSWIEQSGQMPQTVEELSRAPIALRREILSLLPAEAVSSVWRSTLEGYLADHPELTTEQSRVIRDAIHLAAPDLFAIRPDDRQWTQKVELPVRRLWNRAKAAFPPEEVHALFVDMNGALSLASTSPIFACNCRLGLGPCYLNGVTGTCDAISCLTGARCGPMGAYACDGLCNFGTPSPGTNPGTDP